MKLDPLLQARLGTMFAAPEGGRELSGQLLLVSIERLRTGAQPRQNFEDAPLQDLAASIRELKGAGKGIAETGILQPLLVRAGRGEDGGIIYTVTAGERRLRAAKLAGLEQVPVVVSKSDDADAWEQAIVENLLRADLSPLEEAQAFDKLMKTRGYSLREAAKRLGKDKGYLENRLFLLKAPADVRAMVSARADTVRHAREIARIQDTRARRALVEAATDGAPFTLIQERVKAHQERVSNAKTGAKTGEVSARADTHQHPSTEAEEPNQTQPPPSLQVSAHADTSALPILKSELGALSHGAEEQGGEGIKQVSAHADTSLGQSFEGSFAGVLSSVAQLQNAALALPHAAATVDANTKKSWAAQLEVQAKVLRTLAEELKA